MQVTFWGVRGSIPTPGKTTVKYGGNTLCLSIEVPGRDRLVIVDAGSGIRRLGGHLLARNSELKSFSADLFLTHTHLDHILGFPFFAPIYVPETTLTVFGPVTCEEDSLEAILGTQLSYRYFPIRQSELAARIEYIDLMEGRHPLDGGLNVSAVYLNHPLLCLGYRFEHKGRVVCTAFDNEPFQNVFSDRRRGEAYSEDTVQAAESAVLEANHRLGRFVYGADLLIHDAQYTQREYEQGKRGWGHSSVEHAIRFAMQNEVKRLALVHHDPARSDADLDELSARYSQSSSAAGGTEVFFAREDMAVAL
jgi:phosphoribosyl 1,2-cyclic phosphodiesterase